MQLMGKGKKLKIPEIGGPIANSPTALNNLSLGSDDHSMIQSSRNVKKSGSLIRGSALHSGG
jgi:hypothetical protein